MKIEEIIEFAKEYGATVTYDSKEYGIGHTDSTGKFKPYIPLLQQEDCFEQTKERILNEQDNTV